MPPTAREGKQSRHYLSFPPTHRGRPRGPARPTGPTVIVAAPFPPRHTSRHSISINTRSKLPRSRNLGRCAALDESAGLRWKPGDARPQLCSGAGRGCADCFDLRGTQEQLRIARENVGAAQQGLNLTRPRAAAGVATDLDVANASAPVSTTAAQTPSLDRREQEDVDALTLLLGMRRAHRGRTCARQSRYRGTPRGAGRIPSELVRDGPTSARPRHSFTRPPPLSGSRWSFLSAGHALGELSLPSLNSASYGAGCAPVWCGSQH